MSSSSSTTPTIGGRYLHAKTRHPLTVRYVGPLPGDNTENVWLGVEYDDPAHGKGHSGQYKGERVFEAVNPNAGAFIKYVPGATPIVPGGTLVEAIEERYGALNSERPAAVPGQQHQGGSKDEQVVLGSSNSAIIVEAPGMADVRKRIGRLERLKEIGFDGEWVGRLGGTPAERAMFKHRLKGVRTLDMSKNLLGTWDHVAEIAEHFEGLTTLVLNHSRITPLLIGTPDQVDRYRAAFKNIVELHLGNMGYTWGVAVAVAFLFPSLEVLYLNNNHLLTDLSLLRGEDLSELKIKTLSLDGCPISSWTEITSGLVGLPHLEALNLSGMPITTIPPRTGPPFPHLTRLAFTDARIPLWSDVDHLADWTGGKLQNLRFTCAGHHANDEESQPVADHDPTHLSGEPRSDRPICIAKLAALSMLNSTPVTTAERFDAELYYIHYVDNQPPASRASWGRYTELAKLHGTAAGEKPQAPAQTNLKSKLINVHVIPPNGHTATVRILPSAPVSLLAKKVGRTMKETGKMTLCTARRVEAVIALWEPVEEMDEAREVGFYVSDGDYVVAAL